MSMAPKMSMAPNPIVSNGPTRLRFSEHARFRMEDRDIDRRLIERLLNSPKADYRLDEKSGNYVFKVGKYRVVISRSEGDSYIVRSIFSDDQMPP
jgi:hypothetical protein